MRSENSKMSGQMSQIDARCKSLSQELSRFTSENNSLREKIEQQETMRNTRESTEKAEQTNYKQQVASLYTTMRGLQSQLEQTKKLLSTVQQQREMSQQENEELKRELATYYNSGGDGTEAEGSWQM